jgi:tetratricopeptide (TPR) repeat protein
MTEHFIPRESAEKGPLECAAFLAENIRNTDGHSEALKTIVPLYLKRGEVDLAAELANSIDDPFSRDKQLILVAEKCAAVDDDEYAFQLAEAIEDDGLRSETLERIALQKSEKGQLDKADELANDLTHPEYVYADMAVRYAALSDTQRSKSFLERIEFPAAKVAALEAIAELQKNSGDTALATRSLNEALAIASEIEHEEEKLRIWSEIGNIFIRYGEKEEALKTFTSVRDAAANLGVGRRDFFLVSAALGFLQAGDLELADAALDLVSDLTQMASALLGYSREFFRKGETDEALESLEEAYSMIRSQKDTEVRDTRARRTIHRMIAVQFAELGKPERAIETAHEIDDDNEKSAALGQIAQILSINNKELSEQALKGIDEDANRMFALIGVSDTLRMAGEETRSLETLHEAASFTESIEAPAARSAILNAVAARYAQYGQAAEAAALMHENLETIFRIRDESARSIALANAAEVFDDSGIELSEADKDVLASIARRIDL